MKSRISIAVALAAIATLAAIAHAYPMTYMDTKYGQYTWVTAAVTGNYVGGKLYSPDAFVKAGISRDLPSPHFLVVYYYFEWEDMNHVTHYYTDVKTYPEKRYAGQWVQIDPPINPPSPVYYIVAEGRAGYDGIWDTGMASASIPFI